MSRFLKFLLFAYAPLAARHLLVCADRPPRALQPSSDIDAPAPDVAAREGDASPTHTGPLSLAA